ncbi:nuclear transport factor 2 family protein [Amycolatopsis sp. FDAARGOS 1241]|uniref:nuclear transport factor 2 family protein n=1 Tax=Amycolatopsis sp. FDAARGOS 1241 TaxID=2778070 RepID=UPI0019514B88|nr:nuclear transport factor 2 family protein [Amycolatopsis sp. FDAARGOS 1241]QRP43929.1 nuclear transport factor 2 family protein [Amycolatopsis sp. FDAARGOS 1241]
MHTSTPGGGSLGGDRHTRDGYLRWWQRVFRLTTALLRVHSVVVKGPPWRTTVHTDWTDHLTTRDGHSFTNHGSHVAVLRWGRITALSYDWDEDVVRRACVHDARLGVPDATAVPISD